MMYPPQDAYPPQEPAGTVPYSPQGPYSPQDAYPLPQPAGAVPYSSQVPFPPQEPSGAMPYFPQTSFPPQESSGAMPYFPQTSFPPQQPLGVVSYSPQGSYSPQDPSIQSQAYEAPRNLQAKRAIINGLIALVLSVFTLFTLAGFAGLITGTLAIVYGFTGLRTSKQLPNNMGRIQAIIGLALGSVAWFIVIIALIVRTAIPSG